MRFGSFSEVERLSLAPTIASNCASACLGVLFRVTRTRAIRRNINVETAHVRVMRRDGPARGKQTCSRSAGGDASNLTIVQLMKNWETLGPFSNLATPALIPGLNLDQNSMSQ
jgi:hypothetical protein